MNMDHEFFRQAAADAYERMVCSAVTVPPMQAAICLYSALVMWQDRIYDRREILPTALWQFDGWYDRVFLTNLEVAARTAEQQLWDACARETERAGSPPPAGFSLPEIRLRVREILEEQALPMLRESMVSHDLTELGRGSPLLQISVSYRQRQLGKLMGWLEPALEARQALESARIRGMLLTEELADAYAAEAWQALERLL